MARILRVEACAGAVAGPGWGARVGAPRRFPRSPASRHDAIHGQVDGQRLRTKCQRCAHCAYRCSYSPDRCMPTLCTQVDSRAMRWRVHVFSLLVEVIYVAMDGVMARGRAARKAPRRMNPHTPPRPRRCATLRFRPRNPCHALKSGAACAISPGNPSLRRTNRPSSPPGPPRMSSGRHRCAG